MLVKLKDILEKAVKGSYAVGAFNVQNLEFAHGIIDAAAEHSSPIIMQISPRTLAFFETETILKPTLLLAEKASVPVCVHLDHAKDLDTVRKGIEAGFTSIMFDGSSRPLQENIELSRQVSQWCREHHVSLETEVGVVGSDEENKNADIPLQYTKIEEVQQFLNQVDTDALAVSVGSIHGMQTAKVRLNFDLLAQLSSIISIPLVMHGSSGVIDQDLKEAIRFGIRKINVATRLKIAAGSAIYEISRIQGMSGLGDTMQLSIEIRKAVKKAVLSRLSVFNPSSKE